MESSSFNRNRSLTGIYFANFNFYILKSTVILFEVTVGKKLERRLCPACSNMTIPQFLLLNVLQNVTAFCEQFQLWVRYTRERRDGCRASPRTKPSCGKKSGEDVLLLAHAFPKHEQFTRQAGYGILIYRSAFAHGEDVSDGELNLKLLSVVLLPVMVARYSLFQSCPRGSQHLRR